MVHERSTADELACLQIVSSSSAKRADGLFFVGITGNCGQRSAVWLSAWLRTLLFERVGGPTQRRNFLSRGRFLQIGGMQGELSLCCAVCNVTAVVTRGQSLL